MRNTSEKKKKKTQNKLLATSLLIQRQRPKDQVKEKQSTIFGKNVASQISISFIHQIHAHRFFGKQCFQYTATNIHKEEKKIIEDKLKNEWNGGVCVGMRKSKSQTGIIYGVRSCFIFHVVNTREEIQKKTNYTRNIKFYKVKVNTHTM